MSLELRDPVRSVEDEVSALPLGRLMGILNQLAHPLAPLIGVK